MPELPEVETIRRVLEPQLAGQNIIGITVNNPQVIAHPSASAEEFCRLLTGQRILEMQRRGKFLSFVMESGDRLTLHLRMTGCLVVAPPEYPPEKHTHLIVKLSGGDEMRFEDTRRFGRFWLLQSDEEDSCTGISKLGIEPFDALLDAGYLKDAFGKRRKAVKECLLDQSAVCGIGNIYSDEILFAAHVHPARTANSLTDAEWQRVAAAIPERLSYFIEKNTVTPEEYLSGNGKDYRNTPFLQVYGHEKEPCRKCGRALEKCVLGGRSSVYCPCCQK